AWSFLRRERGATKRGGCMRAHGSEGRGVRFDKVLLGLVLSASSAACLWGTTTTDTRECSTDTDCKESTVACRETRCVDHRCVTSNAPEGLAPATTALGRPPSC